MLLWFVFLLEWCLINLLVKLNVIGNHSWDPSRQRIKNYLKLKCKNINGTKTECHCRTRHNDFKILVNPFFLISQDYKSVLQIVLCITQMWYSTFKPYSNTFSLMTLYYTLFCWIDYGRKDIFSIRYLLGILTLRI